MKYALKYLPQFHGPVVDTNVRCVMNVGKLAAVIADPEHAAFFTRQHPLELQPATNSWGAHHDGAVDVIDAKTSLK
jgi:hypothetical protein